jgi:quercetin dioxygenase-like cupin family protein
LLLPGVTGNASTGAACQPLLGPGDHARLGSSTVEDPALSFLVDFDDVPPLEVWGPEVRARSINGERVTLALVELAPDAAVPEHRHENEQMGMVITGAMTFTVDGETRTLGPGGTWRIPSGRPHDAVAGPDGAVVIDVFAPLRTDWDERPHLDPRPAAWPGPTRP